MDARAPRNEDGTPDLSGLWRGDGFVRPQPEASPDDVPVASFRDVGAGFKDGLPLTREELIEFICLENQRFIAR